ncbi:MAG: hypothetical protein K6T85_04810 [Gorillibacterium sp.]|nr:hypothetical protein [Gorillibacterium sp.]
MIGIHPVHRRLAELAHKAKTLGGYHLLPRQEKLELEHCLTVNLDLVRRLDSLKSLAFIAYDCGDMSWHQEICSEIEAAETTML